jgi:isoleucyl-tRNA synthetase
LEKLEEGLKHLEPEDSWALSKINEYSKKIAEALERSAIHQAAQAWGEFVVEVISHKYISVIRPRVWEEEDSPSKLAAYSTLYLLLEAALVMGAPFVPFITEYLYQKFARPLGRKEESVHMLTWPEENNLFNKEFAQAVEEYFEVGEKILTLRTERGVKRRWPLPEAIVVPKKVGEKVEKRMVKVGNKVEEVEVEVPVLSEVAVKKAAKVLAIYANIAEIKFADEKPEGDYDSLEAPDFWVFVKVRVDERTKTLGLAREIVRRIQVMRKERDLPLDYVLKSVRVYTESEELKKVIELNKDYILREVRAERLELLSSPPEGGREWEVEKKKLIIEIVL